MGRIETCERCGETIEGDGASSLHAVCPPNGGATQRRVAMVAAESGAFRDRIVRDLRSMHFHPLVVETVEELQRKIASESAELVLLSAWLDGRVTVDVIEKVAASKEQPKCRFILIGSLFRSDRFRARPSQLHGADGYIDDTTTPGELARLVSRLFEGEGLTGACGN